MNTLSMMPWEERLVQVFVRDGTSRQVLTGPLRIVFEDCLFSGNNPLVVYSPCKKDVVNKIDPRTGEKVKARKVYYTFSQAIHALKTHLTFESSIKFSKSQFSCLPKLFEEV